MKKFILSLFFSLILVLPVLADAQSAGFYIKTYDFYATLGKNKVMTVQETIDVEFIDYRHGIYRSLPTKYSAERFNGKRYEYLDFAEEYKHISTHTDKNTIEHEDGVYTIKIGDANKTIIGPHTYVITYDCVLYDDRINLSDFFYYSPLGAFWETDIKQFNFRIDFEEPLPAGTQFELYSGRFAFKEDELGVRYNYNSNSVWGQANNIPQGNAITLFCELPEGYFVGAKKINPFWEYLFGVLFLASFLVTLYFILTTKHNAPVQTVEFYPPKNFSAAEVGFVIDNEANNIDLMALYPEWAQKGYIEISEDKKHVLTFKKLKDLPYDAPEYQQILFKKTFSKKETFVFKNITSSFVTAFDNAKGQLKETFTKERALYNHEYRSFGLFFLCSLFFTLFLCFSSPISKTENLYICMLVIPYFVMGRVMEATTYRKYFRSIKPAMKTVWTLLFCAFMAYVSYLTLEETEFILPHIVMYVMSILYLIVCLFNGRINQRSDYCVEITGKLLGLKEFIKTAEMPRLKELVAENPAYYYEVFPYAMVFGLADKWSKQFTNISVEAPKWYTSYYPHAVFSAVDFNHTFNTEMTKSMAKVAAASHSSGGGGGHGGGHSGGGGGGGGGGGW